jgi:hypothetical protein
MFSWSRLFLPSIRSSGDSVIGHSEWNNNDFTTSGSSSNTDFTDHEVHFSELEESFVSPVSGVVDLVTETETVFVTVHVAFNSTSSGGDDFDFVVTSSFHEWSTSWHGETVEGINWNSSGGEVDLEGVKSFSTIVLESSTRGGVLGSVLFRDPKWHGWEDAQSSVGSWDFGSTGVDVMVDHGGEEVGISRGLHLEESLHEELVSASRTESTSTSDGGPRGWHGEEGISGGTGGEVPVHVPWSDVGTGSSEDGGTSSIRRLGVNDEVSSSGIDHSESSVTSRSSSNGLGLEDKDITDSSASTEAGTFSLVGSDRGRVTLGRRSIILVTGYESTFVTPEAVDVVVSVFTGLSPLIFGHGEGENSSTKGASWEKGGPVSWEESKGSISNQRRTTSSIGSTHIESTSSSSSRSSSTTKSEGWVDSRSRTGNSTNSGVTVELDSEGLGIRSMVLVGDERKSSQGSVVSDLTSNRRSVNGSSHGARSLVGGIGSDEIGGGKLEGDSNRVFVSSDLSGVEVIRLGSHSLTERWDGVVDKIASSGSTFVFVSLGSDEETGILSVLGGSTTIHLDSVSTGVPDLSRGSSSQRGRVLDVNVHDTGHGVDEWGEVTISHILTEVGNDKLEGEGEGSTSGKGSDVFTEESVDVGAQLGSISTEIPAVTGIFLGWGPLGHNRLLVNLKWVVPPELSVSVTSRTVSNSVPGGGIAELGSSTGSVGSRTVNSDFSSVRWDSNWDFESHFNGGWDVELNTNTSSEGGTVVLNEDSISTDTSIRTILGFGDTTRDESIITSRRDCVTVIVSNVTIGVRVSTYTLVSVSSKMWVETERNKVGVGSGSGFLGDFELGSLLGTSGDDVTSVLLKEGVVNGSRTELVGWVGNSDIEFHQESRPISRSKILIHTNDKSTSNSINSASWGKGGHLGSLFGGGISWGGTKLGVGTGSTPSPAFIGDWVFLPGVSTGSSSKRSSSGTVRTKSHGDLKGSSNEFTFGKRESHGEGDGVTSSRISLGSRGRVWGSSERHGGWWSSDSESRVEDHVGINNWTFDTSGSGGSHGGVQSSLKTDGGERTSFGSRSSNLDTVGSTSSKSGGSTKGTGTNLTVDGKSTSHPRGGSSNRGISGVAEGPHVTGCT